MAGEWNLVLRRVRARLRKLKQENCVDPFFRGHSDSAWKLLPGLARVKCKPITENRLYANFWSLGGHLFPSNLSPWDVLFLMQHYGLPTRLLDWSESFAVALYFAIRGAKEEAAVWVLNPYRLNEQSNGFSQVEDLDTAFPAGYEKLFSEAEPPFEGFSPPVLAVFSKRLSSRMQWQRAAFTLHRDLEQVLESQFTDCVAKITIPKAAFTGAQDFLALAGVNEFTVFPDLDGLSRYLRECELPTA